MKIIIRSYDPAKGSVEVVLEGIPKITRNDWTDDEIAKLLLNAEMRGNSNGQSRTHIIVEPGELQ